MKKRILLFSLLIITVIIAFSAIVNGVQELENFKNLDINLKVADFTVNKSEQNVLNYQYDDDDVEYEFYVSQDVFYLNEERKNKVFSFFNSFNNHNDKFDLSLTNDLNKVDLKGSTSEIIFNQVDVNDFYINTSTGDIDISNSKGNFINFGSSTGNKKLEKLNYKTFFLESSTGNLFAKNIYGNEFNSETSTGNQFLDFIYVDKTNLTSTTGNFDLENINSGEVNIKTSTGKVQLNKGSGEILELISSTGDQKILSSTFNNIYSKTSTGKTYIESTYAKKIRLKTVTGDVVIYSQNYAEDIEIESSSGDITIYNIDFDNYRVEVHTRSGDIETPYGEFDRDFARGNSKRSIYIKTSSGDVVFK